MYSSWQKYSLLLLVSSTQFVLQYYFILSGTLDRCNRLQKTYSVLVAQQRTFSARLRTIESRVVKGQALSKQNLIIKNVQKVRYAQRQGNALILSAEVAAVKLNYLLDILMNNAKDKVNFLIMKADHPGQLLLFAYVAVS